MALEKKYELTDETINYCGHTLYRIRALRDFDNVWANDLGGFIEKEDNLSHEGNCWVSDKAKVFGNAKVYENAWVSDHAEVYANAKVYGHAQVSDRANVYGDAEVFNSAEVFEYARIYNYAKVYGNGYVHGNAKIFGCARVYDHAQIFENAWVYDGAQIYGDACVCGGACVLENGEVYDYAKVSGAVKVYNEAKIFGEAEVKGTEEFCYDDRVYMRSHSTNEAHKKDDGKPRLDLIPPLALMEIGRVLDFGANKYGENNWRNGMDWSRFHGAALRHLLAWSGGESKDAESDLSHLAHAACCLLFLMECEAKKIGRDNRLKKN